MSWRRALVWLLAAGAAVSSFDALRAYALGAPPLAGGVIPTETVIGRSWLAMIWAITIDLAAAVGILGIRDDRRDPRAWATFICAAVASVGFQVFALPAVAARAVPPVALFLAIVVLELPRARPAWAVPTPLGRPLAEPDQPEAEPLAEPPEEPTAEPATNNGSAKVRLLRPNERRKVDRLAADGLSALAISQRTAIPYKPVRQHLRLRELAGAEPGANRNQP